MYKKLSMAIAISLGLLSSQTLYADERTQAKRIFDRLTGTVPTETVLDQMEDSIANDDSTGAEAAIIAMQDPAFYNITLKNFAAPWTNEEETVFESLNDYSATVIGMIRDDVDFRELLYGNIIYTADTGPAYSNSNNDHFDALEQSDLSTVLTRKTQTDVTGLASNATAGIMTTRAAAKSFFYLGTNRAMFRFTVLNHLCTDLEPIKDNTRPADRVRQDVSRSPGGDSRIYLNSCLSCHAGMDGLTAAFAYYDLSYNGDKDTDVDTFNNSAQLAFTDGMVTSKHFNNANNFKSGHITVDDNWINYWRNGPNSLLGWGWGNNDAGVNFDDKGNATGNGAKTMGMELANSQAFAQCQVKKAFQTVCLRDSDDLSDDRTEVDTIVTSFKSGGFQMKEVFRDVAAYCKGN